MPAEINQYVKLRDIVNLYLESSKQTDAAFLRIWRMAFRGFIHMGLNAFWQPKELLLKVNANGSVNFPEDYIMWVALGVFNDVGEFQVLTINRSLTTFAGTLPNRSTRIAPEIGQVSEMILEKIYGNFNNMTVDGGGGVEVPPYGLGSSLLTAGEFTVDDTNRVFLLNPNFPYPHVVLKYISSPEMDNDYEIPIQFQEAMIEWLAWQDNRNVRAVSRGAAQQSAYFEQSFGRRLKVAKKMYKPFRLQEAALLAVEANQLNIKP